MMLISPNEINRILLLSGEDVTKHGKKLFEQSKVSISHVDYTSEKQFEVLDVVEDNKNFLVSVSREKNKNSSSLKYNCGCNEYFNKRIPCKHIIAALFDIYVYYQKYVNFKNSTNLKDNLKINYYEKVRLANNNTTAKKIDKEENSMQIFFRNLDAIKASELLRYYEEINYKDASLDGKIKIEPELEIDGFNYSNLSVKFKIGIDKMYKIKDIYEFASLCFKKKELKYGKSLKFIYNVSKICDENIKVAEFLITKANEYNKFFCKGANNSLNKNLAENLDLKYKCLDEFFEMYENQKINISGYYFSNEVTFVNCDPVIDFVVKENDGNIEIIKQTDDEFYIYYGQLYNYILYKGKLFRCSEEFSKSVLPFLKVSFEAKSILVKIPLEQATNFCEYMVPNLEKKLGMSYENDVIKKYSAEKLGVKIYLDVDEKYNIVADVKFIYGNKEFNPFLEQKSEDILNINRNKMSEDKLVDILNQNNFKLNNENGKLYIDDNNDIYEFMLNGINTLMEKYEVLVTDKFKSKNIIRPKNVSLGVRIKNDLLEIETYDLGFDEEELIDVIKSYRLKKKYYRLKDGSFVDIDFSGIDTLVDIADNLGISDKDIAMKKIKVPKYRAMYLNDVLNKSDDIATVKENSFKEVIRNMNQAFDMDIKVPKSMDKILREYQKNGYNWLKTLDNCGFGGILADDMGLGKTLQVIALLEDVRENKKKDEKNTTSIVICPSSLYINWEKEINKFAPNIKVLVVNGSANKRKFKIENALKYDVIVTSYDLLKRDIEEYKDINFRYIIADEAQYIKNNNTKNAKALKCLKGKTKFALTGTPMENSLAELWSIFDFCMPGYLFTYSKFKERYETKIVKDEDKKVLEVLSKVVAPFILRRTKKEVLKELPDKTETVMYNAMEESQEKVYRAYLKEAKRELEKEINENGMEKSQMKILPVITRLRQICCHPSLFLENYDGESAKLNQCVQLIEDAYNSKHKIIVFSQFVSMFEIMKKELEKRNIKYYELTGKTKADTRVEMVDRFNKDEEMCVFLVSLKAGGTGLNLIGADIVIHFDPWWNLSVQNQATDRAYRIGQRKNVQVFSLITEHSIEEKVKKLQEAKMKLTENVIKPGETFISNMSKEEIMKLFEN